MLLVAGASGGVGSLAVQLAVKAGATVVAPALPEDDAFLRGLGVSEIVRARATSPPRCASSSPTASTHCSTSSTTHRHLRRRAQGRGARRLTDRRGGRGPGRTYVMATPTRENLERLGALLADGTLRVPVQPTYPLADAPQALSALTGQHTQGKLAIQVS